jgi:hypothetical protein
MTLLSHNSPRRLALAKPLLAIALPLVLTVLMLSAHAGYYELSAAQKCERDVLLRMYPRELAGKISAEEFKRWTNKWLSSAAKAMAVECDKETGHD